MQRDVYDVCVRVFAFQELRVPAAHHHHGHVVEERCSTDAASDSLSIALDRSE